MPLSRSKRFVAVVAILVLAMAATVAPAAAIAPGTSPFQDTWARTDQPVTAGAVSRTWMWGPSAFSSTMNEPYDDRDDVSPDGRRLVQYYDKSRMEITHPDGDPSSIWYVTNGRLSYELITGQLQDGDFHYEQRTPAPINVAGDADDQNGPTYATFTNMLTAPPVADGAAIIQRVARDGTVTDDPALKQYGVTAAQHVQVAGIDHQVASPFWAFMNSQGAVYHDGQIVTENLFVNPYYATGYPITEAYWATIKVAGTPHDVLVQCFERRCLTYTPQNPEGWQVEAGNIGQHYYMWRYGTNIPSEPPASDPNDLPIGPSPAVQWGVGNPDNGIMQLANQSPYPLTITFEGPTPLTVTLDACGDCHVYANEGQFEGCRDDTPMDTHAIAPGNYRVTAAWQGGNVTPASGPWTIVPDTGYGECLFVVQQTSNGNGANTSGPTLTTADAALPR